jgi:glycosyltransferase involved in cell wall biosynthesis
VRLDIYGDGPEKDCLVKQSKQDSRIRFRGFIDNIYEVLNQYDVLVLPTRIPEACPMVLIEAMCLGVPVLVSNIGGQFELLSMSKFGVSFESEDHVDFSNKLNLFHSMQFISCLHEASDLEYFVDKVKYNSFSILIRKVICE